MATIHGEYLGDLRCKVTHSGSNTVLLTDAPIDNHGKGESFSPTDIFCASLLTCIATIMGIYAQNKKINISGMKMEAIKEMATDLPRRIVAIKMQFWMPSHLDDAQQKLLESAVKGCPVHHSIHPNIEIKTQFHW